MTSLVAQPETKGDAIVRATSFQRKYHRQTITFDPRVLQNWQVSMSLPSISDSNGPISGLGALEVLPNELFRAILKKLDIQSALNFLQVSRLAHELVSSMKEYQHTLQHAPAALLAMVETGIAQSFTFEHLYHVMCLRECENCDNSDNLGRYLYLPTAKKICEKCLFVEMDMSFRTVTLSSFAKGANRPAKQLRQALHVVKSIPGEYFGYGTWRNRSLELINYIEAINIVNEDCIEPGYGYHPTQPGDSITRHMVSVPLPIFNDSTREMEPVLGCRGCVLAWDEGFARGFRRRRGLTEKEGKERFNKHHSRSSLLEHFHNCRLAKWIWRESRQGTKFIGYLETDFTERRILL